MAMSTGALMEFGEKKALSTVTGSSATTVTTYLALITAAPTATDLTMLAYTSTEFATATAYARLAYGPGTPTSASPSVIGNNATITYGPFTSAPGTCTWAILTDASTGTSANVIAGFLLGNPRTPLLGDSLVAAAYAGTGTSPGFTIQV